MDLLLDASALMAIILNEPNKNRIISLTRGAMLLTPDIINAEIGNALVSLFKQKKLTEIQIIDAYKAFELIPLRKLVVEYEKALGIASRFNIYAYDAYYLEVAKRMKIPLITFDRKMQSVGKELNINILGNSNESI